jgi:membrane fusion protein (multidrug efflux system)
MLTYKKMKPRNYLLAALTATLLASCTAQPSQEGEMAAEPTAPARYEAVRVTATPPAQSLSLPGELDSYFQTDIFPRVSSYVRKLNVDVGDQVRPGQVLAELEAPELSAAVSEAQSRVQAAQASFSSTRASYRRLRQTSRTAGAVSPLSLEQARAQAQSDSLLVAASRAHYQSTAQMVKYLRITAPFAGIITERNLAPGAFVGPGGQNGLPIFKVRQMTRLRLRLAVPEAYVGGLHDGQPVQFTVRTFPGETFTGAISRTSNSVRPDTRSEQIEIDIANPQSRLKPGMFATASLPVKAVANSLFVPKSAVVSTAERTYVIRVAGGKADLVDVQKGDETNGQLQIFGALKPGDEVLKTGNEEIDSQTPLAVTLAAK